MDQKRCNHRLWHTGVLAVLLVLLVSCQPADTMAERRQFSPEALLGLGGKPLLEEGAGNCSFDQLEAREEGFRFAGSVGGLALPFKGEPAPVAQTSMLSAELEGLETVDGSLWFGSLEHDVALLVLDDFKGHQFPQMPGNGVYRLGEGLFKLSNDDLPASASERIAALESKLDALLASGELSHGALVFNHTLAMVSHLADVVAFDDRAVLFERDGHKILVSAVDTQDFKTDLIASSLENRIQSLVASNNIQGVAVDLKRFSVNMSFAIVPCSVLADYEQARNSTKVQSFDGYIALLTCLNAAEQFNLPERACSETSASFQQLLDDLWALATTPLADDPLQDLIVQLSDMGGATQADAVTFAASAGNYGEQLDYPLAPAAWDFVTSVSAGNAGTDELAYFSNPAEIQIAGAWFVLSDHSGFQAVDPALLSQVEVVYAGTSFAAPAIAVFSAFDLAKKVPHCMTLDTASGKLFMPHLPYFPVHPFFDNLALQRALSNYCQ